MFQAQVVCALADGKRARKERSRCVVYKCDPRWITVTFEGKCVHCKRSIYPGECAFYYPDDRSLYCEAENCSKAASRDFSARAFDEENNTSM